ncbi:expressed unknown protein [Seminavis robusta]|uniref:Uncharacterized protein n=1 Tax=Seminavis robusta TaxID=568900 RepID=A0A9N8ED09_9STRA|nr:expressed unknown protein [Seminavis robusta]|eukprot:Sro996_g229250.1 n/a (395) ;mRNA; f:11684-12868
MMQLRPLLSLLLVPVVAAHGNLRSPERRNLQSISLASNQIAFNCQYDMQLSDNGETSGVSSSPDDNNSFTTAAYGWIQNAISAAQGAQSTTGEAAWSYDSMANTIRYTVFYTPVQHVMSVQYIVDFNELVAPTDEVGWVAAMNSNLDTGNLLSATSGISGIFRFLSSVENVQCEHVAASAGSRIVFEEAYVLPFRLNWAFNTSNQLAPPGEFQAAVNATEKWIAENWENTYGVMTTWRNRNELQNVDIFQRYTAFSQSSAESGLNRYQQQLGLYVQLVVGANNITDVPTVSSYLETLQLTYPLGDFVTELNNFMNEYLQPGIRILPGTQQSYAVIPTFEVSNINDSGSRTGPADDVFYTDYASVSVDLNQAALDAARANAGYGAGNGVGVGNGV